MTFEKAAHDAYQKAKRSGRLTIEEINRQSEQFAQDKSKPLLERLTPPVSMTGRARGPWHGTSRSLETSKRALPHTMAKASNRPRNKPR